MVFNQPTVNCPNCGHMFAPQIQQVLDVREDPSAVSQLLSGQANVVNCPNCGFGLQVLTPLVYHDPTKELLLIHVPMELNLSQDQQEHIIGGYIRSITDSLPVNERKGYLLNPRRTFTLQGMIDTVMEAEGISKEMLEGRQQQLELVEKFIQSPPDTWQGIAEQYNEQLDENFFSMLTATAEMMVANGQVQVAQQLVSVRDTILPFTSYGAELLEGVQRQEETIQQVTQDLNNLGNNVTRKSLAKVVLNYVDDEEKVQIFTSMVRSALDYQFFEELAALIDETNSKGLREQQLQMRDYMLEVLKVIEEQSEQMINQAAMILESILRADDIEEAIRQNLAVIDDTFMAVLRSYTAQAEQQGSDPELLQRLNFVQEYIANLIMETSPPEVRFINELIQIEDMLEVRLLLVERASEFGPNLVRYLDALLEQLESQGQTAIAQRISEIREEAIKVIDPEAE